MTAYAGQITTMQGERTSACILAFDQISRPYYPQRGDDEPDIGENEEVSAIRRRLNFLFDATAALKGLQVLLIEHAYFGDYPKYVAATRKRWNKLSGDALIPLNWPRRANTLAKGRGHSFFWMAAPRRLSRPLP